MKYDPAFLTKAEADALFNACMKLPLTRGKTQFSKLRLHASAGSFGKPYPWKRGTLPLAQAPVEIQRLAAKLPKAATRFGILVYQNEHDSMNWHQHKKCYSWPNQTVYVISLGATRSIGIRKKGAKPPYKVIQAAHGSLYVLPHAYNKTHEHAVLKDTTPKSTRISIDCTCVP